MTEKNYQKGKRLLPLLEKIIIEKYRGNESKFCRAAGIAVQDYNQGKVNLLLSWAEIDKWQTKHKAWKRCIPTKGTYLVKFQALFGINPRYVVYGMGSPFIKEGEEETQSEIISELNGDCELHVIKNGDVKIKLYLTSEQLQTFVDKFIISSLSKPVSVA